MLYKRVSPGKAQTWREFRADDPHFCRHRPWRSTNPPSSKQCPQPIDNLLQIPVHLFSLPSILSSLLEPLATLVDTALVGRTGNRVAGGAWRSGTIILSSFHLGIQFFGPCHHPRHILRRHPLIPGPLLKERVRICLTVGLGAGCCFPPWSCGPCAFSSTEWPVPKGNSFPWWIPTFSVRIPGHPLIILYTNDSIHFAGTRQRSKSASF